MAPLSQLLLEESSQHPIGQTVCTSSKPFQWRWST